MWSGKTRKRGSLGGPSTAEADTSTSRKREALWLIAATGASLLGAPVGAVAAILSPMVFDPHQNIWNPAAWIAFVLIVTFWIVCIAAPFGAWVAYLRRQRVLDLAGHVPARPVGDRRLRERSVPAGLASAIRSRSWFRSRSWTWRWGC